MYTNLPIASSFNQKAVAMTAISDTQKELVESQVEWLPGRLRELRESAGFTQKHVGAAIECTPNRICDLERGRYDIKWSTICRYALAVGVTLDKLLAGCPRTYTGSKLPSAVEKSQQYEYLLKLLDRTKMDAKELRGIEKWAKEKRKSLVA